MKLSIFAGSAAKPERESSGRSYFARKIFMMGGNKNGADAERTIKGGSIKSKDKRRNEVTKLKVYGLDAFQVSVTARSEA